MEISKFTILKTPEGTEGIDTKEIETKMGKELYEAFTLWFAGKTGVIIDGKYCVFPWDLEKWLNLRKEALNVGKTTEGS